MRRAARIDGNQTTIVRALEKAGASVQSLAAVGRGCPDLLVGYRGRNYLLEVKDGRKPPSRWKLTNDEAAFHRRWDGNLATVLNPQEALSAIGAVPSGVFIPRGNRESVRVGTRQQT